MRTVALAVALAVDGRSAGGRVPCERLRREGVLDDARQVER
ncbi:MAG TPA: hypothetical protein VFY65_15840 [Longimicrobium sp.]|nr:hypothetical protein [Longimicrobium sp.]